MSKINIGSSFDDFLKEEGLLEEATAVAVKRVIAHQISQAINDQGLTKSEMASLMGTSRAALDRLLDPNNSSVTLQTLQNAAQALGGRVNVEFETKYLRFTDETNALDDLKRAEDFIRETSFNPSAWKWVIHAMHGALYGFAIAACKGSDYESVTKPTKKGERLITLDEALKSCQNKEWMGTIIGVSPLKLSTSQKDSIKRLKTLRNRFQHYVPGGWSIQILGLPQISMDVLDVIYSLTVETFRYQHLDSEQRLEIKRLVNRCKEILRLSQPNTELLRMEDHKSRKRPRTIDQ